MTGKGAPKGPHRRTPKPTAYAGPTICLRCDQTFESWDRRQNRLCPLCRHNLDREPSEERRFPFHPPMRRGRNPDEG
jgi:predicted amidophosphoribosyltransferase